MPTIQPDDVIVRLPKVLKPKGNKAFALVHFIRPGVNETRDASVPNGTTIEAALKAANIEIRTDKEGIAVKGSRIDADGKAKKLVESVEDGVTYFILPGISSA